MHYDWSDTLFPPADSPGRRDFIPEALYRAGADFVSHRRVTVHPITSPGTNLMELTGSVQCGFGIVHHPILTLACRDGELLVERYQCGCRECAKGRFCAHCAALLVAHYGHADARILTAADGEPEDTGCSGIRIRLGTRQKTGDSVCWTPEDARRLATANIAIVGRENTGGPQMVQSVAIQLLRQKAQAEEPLGLLIFSGLAEGSETRSTFPEAAGARLLKLHKLPVNPFSLRFLERKPQLHTHTAIVFADALTQSYGLGALEKSTLVQSVLSAYEKRGITSDPLTWDRIAPTFADVYAEYSSRPQSQHSSALGQIMENLSQTELFDSDFREETSLYDSIQGALILDMSGYPDTLKHFALRLLLETLFAQMCGRERTLSRGLQKMILIDNAGALLETGCSGLEGLLTQGREFGLGVLLSARSMDLFQTGDFDYRVWVRTWMLHNVEDLRKTDLEFLLQSDIQEIELDRLYQESRHLRKLHSLICIGTEEPVLAEDLPFYEIAADTAQSYLAEARKAPEPEPLAGMPLLEDQGLDTLVNLENEPSGPMATLEALS